MQTDEGRAFAREFGAHLKRRRKAAGLSQKALSERTGLSVNVLGAYERGQRFPRGYALALIAQVLGPPSLAGELLALGEPDSRRARREQAIIALVLSQSDKEQRLSLRVLQALRAPKRR